MGGKWTSFRHMGEETIDAVSDKYGVKSAKSVSETLRLAGGYSVRELLGYETAGAGFWKQEYSDQLIS